MKHNINILIIKVLFAFSLLYTVSGKLTNFTGPVVAANTDARLRRVPGKI